ncbi:MAG TPA: hypothetical protein VFJ25_10900 [Casimicrobiaceae bacterium]|nr:hypothetical protein [Casimicrobiaceae bacterium]
MTGRLATARRSGAAASPVASGWNLLLVTAFVSGFALRAWQVDIQILLEDEWHAIHKLLRSSALDIVTHLGHADYSIPLTLYYQWLERNVGLSEWSMHAPSVVAAVALLLIGPSLITRWSPPPVRAIWLALVAVSPLFVYFAKIARPYALTSVLTFVGIVAFRAWWREGRRFHAIAYVVTTFLAGWLHLVSLGFALLPLAYYGLAAIVALWRATSADRTTARLGLRRVIAIGVATALPLALVLLPPVIMDREVLAWKAGRDHVTVDSVYRTLLMLAGTGHAGLGVALWASVAYGWMRLHARDAELARYLATIVVVGFVACAASGAYFIAHPLVLARYATPALPFVLLLAAEGIYAALVAIASAPLRPLAAAGLVIALLLTGPIPREWRYPNQFWGHMMYQFDYDPAHNPYVDAIAQIPISPFYQSLASRAPGSVTLVEMPWRIESQFNALPRFQAVHRQRVKVALITPTCGVYDWGQYPESRSGMRMREMVHLSALLRGEVDDADYLVVHRHPPQEPWPDLRGCLPLIEAKFGAPVYRDDAITVFSIAQVSPLGNTHRPVQQ